MLYRPHHSTESLFLSFSPQETTSPEGQQHDEFEVIAEAFRGVIANRELRQNREVALGFIRNYAVTRAGLGNTEARIAYFEAQRRCRELDWTVLGAAIELEELQLAE